MSGCVDKQNIMEMARVQGFDGEMGVAGIDDALKVNMEDGILIRATVTMLLEDKRPDKKTQLDETQQHEMATLSGSITELVKSYVGAKGTFFTVKKVDVEPFPPIPVDGNLFDFMRSMSSFLTLMKLCSDTYADRCHKDVRELIHNLLSSKIVDTMEGLGELFGMMFIITKTQLSAHREMFEKHVEECDQCGFTFKGFVDKMEKVFFIDRKKVAQA